MAERRYDDREVTEIFGRAAKEPEAGPRRLASRDGLTLAELQEIGREVGISAAQIATAARALDSAPRTSSHRLLGVTIGVGRTVELDRRLSDDDWERLVVLLRDTFDARGTVRADGSLRQWTNSNLHILVEPGESGHRIRMRTTHGSARALMTAGVGILVSSALVGIVALSRGTLPASESLTALLPLALMGSATFAVGAIRLRGWANARQRQFEQIAARLLSPDSSR